MEVLVRRACRSMGLDMARRNKGFEMDRNTRRDASDVAEI